MTRLRSLRTRLLWALLGPLAGLVLVGAVLDWRAADEQARSSHDRALASLAVGVAARLETERDADLPTHLVAMMRTMNRFNPVDRVSWLVLDERGHVLAGDAALAVLAQPPGPQNPALRDALLGAEPVRAAVYAYEGPDGRATIVVTETQQQRAAEVRHAIATAAATNIAMALAVALTAALAVGYALQPLHALGHDMEGHDVRDLRPVRLRRVPAEVAPLVRALNRLVQRLRRTVQARQAFVANTAHQLRNPLAGLSAQAALLQQEPLPPRAAARAADVAQAVQRLVRLVHQLLALARVDEDTTRQVPMQPLNLADVLQEAASACLDDALARDVDLGFEPADAPVTGVPWLLRELLLNAVGNAIVHTPRGTAVTVRCGIGPGARPFVEVEDDGPGIPAADRERVFDRFVRLQGQDRPGTGLGLPIVREIAVRHRAEVHLHEGAHGRGLRLRVDFPPADNKALPPSSAN